MRQVRPVDERAHPWSGQSPWVESWSFDLAAPDGALGASLALALHPARRSASFRAALVGCGRLVAVADDELALPRRASLELRGPGLWVDHRCETPLEHWSIGLEAFGSALDRPEDALGDLRGDRTPLGFDLEWESSGDALAYPDGGYTIACRVHGEILVGSEVFEIDGWGRRDHTWGPHEPRTTRRAWWSFRTADGTAWVGAVPGAAVEAAFGLVQPDGARPRPTAPPTASLPSLLDGADARGLVSMAGRDLVVEPRAWAPVALDRGDGRLVRLDRALARVATTDGSLAGVGWFERAVDRR